MAKDAKEAQPAKSGEELGEQLLRSVSEMKAGLHGRVHRPEGSHGSGHPEPETENVATQRRLADELDDIARHCAKLPVLDPRTPDEILGYESED